MINLDVFYYYSRDVAMATNFRLNLQNDLYSAVWHSETDRIMQVFCFPKIALRQGDL